MAQKLVKYKVVKDKLSSRVRICRLLGRERGVKLLNGEVIECDKSELDIMKKNQWVTLKKEVENGS